MKKYIYLIALTLLALTIMTGCIMPYSHISMNYPEKDAQYTASIKWYSDILENDKTTVRQKSKANLKLALLYSHFRNPEKDYSKASEHMEAAISLNQKLAKNDNVANFRAILEEAARKATVNTERLNRLKKENYKLLEENAGLMKVIEELNELEVELEKRRKEMR